MTTMRVVGECFFWYRLTRVFPDKFHRAVKWLCVCVCLYIDISNIVKVFCGVLLVVSFTKNVSICGVRNCYFCTGTILLFLRRFVMNNAGTYDGVVYCKSLKF